MVRRGVQLESAVQQSGAETHLKRAGGFFLVDLGRCNGQTVRVDEEQADSLGAAQIVKASCFKAYPPATKQGGAI